MLNFFYQNASHFIEYHHKKGISEKQDYHLHEKYEIYYLVEGNINYFVNKSTYTIKSGELLIVNSNEIHTHSLQKNENYERILILFDPKLAEMISPENFNLLECFTSRLPGEKNKIRLTAIQQENLLSLFHKLELSSQKGDTQSDVLTLAFFIELMVFINTAFKDNLFEMDKPILSERLLPILEYINENISEDLSLEVLEKIFFINRFYLSRIFKENTGIPIHQYIILKRVLRARTLLKNGYDVTKTCYASGFKDYSSFIRMFKKLVGMLPSEYRKHPF